MTLFWGDLRGLRGPQGTQWTQGNQGTQGTSGDAFIAGEIFLFDSFFGGSQGTLGDSFSWATLGDSRDSFTAEGLFFVGFCFGGSHGTQGTSGDFRGPQGTSGEFSIAGLREFFCWTLFLGGSQGTRRDSFSRGTSRDSGDSFTAGGLIFVCLSFEGSQRTLLDLRGLRDPGNHKGLFYSWGMFFVGFFFWGDLRGLGVGLFLPEDLRELGGLLYS